MNQDGINILAGIGLVLAVIAGVIYGVGWGLTSIGNLISHGEFTANTAEAEVHDNLANPTFFAERAVASKMRIVDVEGRSRQTFKGDALSIYVVFSVSNGDSVDHAFELQGNARVRVNAASGPKVVDSWCYSKAVIVPAGRTMGSFSCEAKEVKGATNVLEVSEPPAFMRIDDLPVAGGPPNVAGWWNE